jgi:plasmid replication initiation protein
MNYEDKLKQIVELKRRVIEQAVKDINELSELHVSYQFAKGRRIGQVPAKVERVKFFIVDTKAANRQYYFEDYKVVFNVVAGVYDESTAMGVADWFMDNKRIVAASERLAEVRRDMREGVIKKHGAHNYMLAVLEGFGVLAALLPASQKKTKSAHKSTKNEELWNETTLSQ